MLYNTIVSKTKKIIISCSVIGGAILILVACLLLVFLLKPKQGAELEAKTVGNHIYICTQPEQERTFKFKFVGDGVEKVFDSVSSQFDITELLWSGELSFGTEYQISYCLVEPTGILAGEFSEEISFVPTIRLDAPTITLDEQGSTISWQEVRGAEYYVLYYNDGGNTISCKVEGTSFDVSQIKGGERQIYVTSSSDQTYFYESEMSNVISCTVEHQIAEFESAYIDEQLNLHIIAAEIPPAITMFVGKTEYTVEMQQCQVVALPQGYEIEFSVKLVYGGGEITVCPKGDDFNIFSGEPTTVSENNLV